MADPIVLDAASVTTQIERLKFDFPEMLILAGKAREDDGTSEKGAITEQEAKRRKYKTRNMTAQ